MPRTTRSRQNDLQTAHGPRHLILTLGQLLDRAVQLSLRNLEFQQVREYFPEGVLHVKPKVRFHLLAQNQTVPGTGLAKVSDDILEGLCSGFSQIPLCYSGSKTGWECVCGVRVVWTMTQGTPDDRRSWEVPSVA